MSKRSDKAKSLVRKPRPARVRPRTRRRDKPDSISAVVPIASTPDRRILTIVRLTTAMFPEAPVTFEVDTDPEEPEFRYVVFNVQSSESAVRSSPSKRSGTEGCLQRLPDYRECCDSPSFPCKWTRKNSLISPPA